MPLSQPEYQDRKALIRSTVSGQLGRLWLGLPDYRDASIDRFVRIAVPKVQAGQIAVARATAAHLGGPVLPRAEIVSVRMGVSQVDEYRRPAIKTYTELARGSSLGSAVQSGLGLLDSLVGTDIQLASTHQARHSLRSQGFTYYRRVLTGSENCARCAIASTQRYHVGDLMPIHPGCDCGVEAVEADFDPGQVIDPEYLDQVHAEVKRFTGFSDPGGRDYQDLIVTHQHGEYGPTLAWRRDNFTGPSVIGRTGVVGESLQLANPNYNLSAAYKTNCANAVTAFELQMRGTQVSALGVGEAAVARGGIHVNDFLAQWRTPDGAVPSLSALGSRTAVERALREAGDGSRGFVLVNWKRDYGGGGHVFSVVNEGGTIRFLDPQSGIEYGADQFANVKPKNVWFLRSDDLIVQPDALTGVVE